jgi:hypothetical protein
VAGRNSRIGTHVTQAVEGTGRRGAFFPGGSAPSGLFLSETDLK